MSTALAVATLAGVSTGAYAASDPGPTDGPAPLFQPLGAEVVKDHYIVVLKGKPKTADARASAKAVDRAKAKGIKVDKRFEHAINAYTATLTSEQLKFVRNDPAVDHVEADVITDLSGDSPAAAEEQVSPSAVETAPSWGLDRIDQLSLPLDGKYTYGNAGGPNVTVFVFGFGVSPTHKELTSLVDPGYVNAADAQLGTADCHGVGNAVASAVAGHTLGVAKGQNGSVRIRPVRITNCGSFGLVSLAKILDGLNWISASATGKSVVAYQGSWRSSGFGDNNAAAINSAVANMRSNGILFTIMGGFAASGNSSDMNMCDYAPQMMGLDGWLVVGLADANDTARGPWGQCVTIFAPAIGTRVAWKGSDTATIITDNLLASTAANGYTAGVVALAIKLNPSFTPAQIEQLVLAEAQPVVQGTVGGSDPLLLHWTAVTTPPPGEEGPDAPKDDIVIYRTSNGSGEWYVKRNEAGGTTSFAVFGHTHGGWAGDIPLTADFNGDKIADFVIYRVVNGIGTWYVQDGSDHHQLSNMWGVAHGSPGDIPFAGDFDRDGKADYGVYRIAPPPGGGGLVGRWYVKSGATNQPLADAWGVVHGSPGDVPVVGDLNADRKADFGVYRVTNGSGNWYFKANMTGRPQIASAWGVVHGGLEGDVPVVGNFNGDRYADLGIYRPNGGLGSWYVRSGASAGTQLIWGASHGGVAGDVPLAGNFG